jgi:hypothetical protein
MNDQRNNESTRDPLDKALALLSRDVQPSRDLWAGISAEIGTSAVVTIAKPRRFVAEPRSWMRIAAGIVLVVGSSLTTYFVVHGSMQQQVLQAQNATRDQMQLAPALPSMPASFAGEAMGAGYVDARAALDKEFKERIATLPPVTRAKLERDLADLRMAAADIAATLAKHPSDPLLQELLLSTYQSELGMLGSVTDMTNASETRL